MKAVVAAFNQEKALVGAFSVITNLRKELFEAPLATSATQGQQLIMVKIAHLNGKIYFCSLFIESLG